jgi:hypothetical protein
MKATIMSSIEDLAAVKTKAVILAFRPSMQDILSISAAGIKTIQINPSSAKSMSKSVTALLDQMKMTMKIANIQGIRRDKHGDVVEI